MKVNPKVKSSFIKYLNQYHGKSISLKKIYQNAPDSIQDIEIHILLSEFESKGFITKCYKNKPSSYNFIEYINDDYYDDEISIVVSKPKIHGFSLETVQGRNGLIETIDCFKTIINESVHTLRICSPFVERNVVATKNRADFETLIKNALFRGVRIKILTRELKNGKEEQVQWLQNIASSVEKENLLEIRDYHYEYSNKRIESSTHAKMVIADNELAYVGSGELRKNSLLVNFEVGIQLRGPSVFGLVEVFDAIFYRGDVYEFLY